MIERAIDEYHALERFNLKDHGDDREKEWGPLIQAAFPAYEVFWRRYIVPLTNRINPAISVSNPEWIRLRPEISNRLESMTMCHYSVFHYLARAKDRMRDHGFPEDVFVLLDACRENVGAFFKGILNILGDFGRPAPDLPCQQQFMCSAEDRAKPEPDRGGFVRAQKYRNAMIHNPVLGRISDETTEMLPRWTVLKKVEHSWRAARKLELSDWINSHDLFEALWQEIAEFLQHEWQSIIDAMEELRSKPQHAAKFKNYWVLPALMPITASSTTVRVRLPPTASSVVSTIGILSSATYSPTAAMPLMNVSPDQPLSSDSKEAAAAESDEEPEESK